MLFQNKNNQEFWIKQDIPHFNTKELAEVQVMVGNFSKVGRTFKTECQRTYFLVKQILLYSDVGNGNPIKGYVNLDIIYAQFCTQNGRYIITLNNSGHLLRLTTNNVKQYTEWKETLEGRCILQDFENEFQLGPMIGNGSFSSVHECKNSQNDVYAVKIINKLSLKQLNKNKQLEQQIMNEISSLRLMSHQSVLQLHRVYESPIKLYLVTELIQGSEIVSQKLQKCCFSAEDFGIFLYKIFDAMASMHEQKIIHRDIKPANILLRNNSIREPVIIDLGLAAFQWQKNPPFPNCGSPGYSAPEVLKYEETKKLYTSQCDIYSLGITIFVMVYGYHPFKSQDQRTTIKRNIESYVELPNHPKLPQQFENLMQMMLKKYPKDRITAAQALKHPFFEVEFNLRLKLPSQVISKQQFQLLHKMDQQFKIQQNGVMNSNQLILINQSLIQQYTVRCRACSVTTSPQLMQDILCVSKQYSSNMSKEQKDIVNKKLTRLISRTVQYKPQFNREQIEVEQVDHEPNYVDVQYIAQLQFPINRKLFNVFPKQQQQYQ